MNNKSNDVYISDISKALIKIDKYLFNITYEIFVKDEMRQDAVIRQLEKIGEAANHLTPDFVKQNPDFPLQESIAMRDFLIHGYDEVDLDTVL